MRIVRFTEATYDLPKEWLQPRWGMLVDQAIYPLEQAPYEDSMETGVVAPEIVGSPLALEEARLLMPVAPSKIICVGRNYAEHAAEFNNDVPEEPLLFFKPPSSLLAHEDDIVHPAISQRVDHEAELAIVIGQRCRYVPEDEALDTIFAYTVANDVTARDIQRSDKLWTRGKGFDTFCPIGPWLDTHFDFHDRAIRCLVNGEVRQESNTDLMIFSIQAIVAYISQFATLEPGDLILTGTPSGVSALHPGDVVTVEIDGLGTLSNPVISEEDAMAQSNNVDLIDEL